MKSASKGSTFAKVNSGSNIIHKEMTIFRNKDVSNFKITMNDPKSMKTFHDINKTTNVKLGAWIML